MCSQTNLEIAGTIITSIERSVWLKYKLNFIVQTKLVLFLSLLILTRSSCQDVYYSMKFDSQKCFGLFISKIPTNKRNGFHTNHTVMTKCALISQSNYLHMSSELVVIFFKWVTTTTIIHELSCWSTKCLLSCAVAYSWFEKLKMLLLLSITLLQYSQT